MVYDSSVALAIRDFGTPYYYLIEQGKWLVIGCIVFAIVSTVHYKTYRPFIVPGFFLTCLLLMIVFIPGIGVQALGARRWINLGLFVLQPAELMKLMSVLYFSYWFSEKEKRSFVSFLLLAMGIAGLIILEPDLGTSLVFLTIAFGLYFFSGAPLFQFALIVPIAAAIIGGIAVVTPYRLRRLLTFFDPESDPLGASYHIRQATIALGSGGWFGLGIGQSRQKYEYLPEANTDSIFAIIGEEFGFVGASILIFLFLFLLYRGFMIAKKTSDPFARYIVLGVITWIGMQATINIAAMVALIPLTGIPLPFISYGGSSLVVAMAAMGLVVNISKHTT